MRCDRWSSHRLPAHRPPPRLSLSLCLSLPLSLSLVIQKKTDVLLVLSSHDRRAGPHTCPILVFLAFCLRFFRSALSLLHSFVTFLAHQWRLFCFVLSFVVTKRASSPLAKGRGAVVLIISSSKGRRRGWQPQWPRRVAAFGSLTPSALGSLRCVVTPLLRIVSAVWRMCVCVCVWPSAFARDAFASCIRLLTSFAWFVYQLSYRADDGVAVAVAVVKEGDDGRARVAAW